MWWLKQTLQRSKDFPFIFQSKASLLPDIMGNRINNVHQNYKDTFACCSKLYLVLKMVKAESFQDKKL